MKDSQQPVIDEEINSSKMLKNNNLGIDDMMKVDKMSARITEKNLKLIASSKSPVETNLIMKALRNHFIFYNLKQQELENIKEKMLFCHVKQGEYIYRQGDIGTCFFIVQRGQVQILVDEQFRKSIKETQGFGQIALLYNTERISSARAEQKCQLWVIDRVGFREAVQQIIIKDYQQNRKIIDNVQLFSGLSNELKDNIALICIEKVYYKNQPIIKEGDPGSCFFFIKSGETSVYKGSKFLKKLTKGEYFGEQSLFYNTMRQLTIKADEDVSVLILTRDTLNKTLGNKIYDVTFKNFIQKAFENNKILEKLSKKDLQKIIEHMKVSSYRANETILRRGVSGFQKIVVMIEGQLKNEKNGAIVAIKGECYGQEGIIVENNKKIMQDQIVMNCYGVVAELTNFQIIKELNITKEIFEKQQEHLGFKSENTYKKSLAAISIKDLYYVKELSKSLLGGIVLTKSSDSFYCVRAYYKSLLEQYDVSKYILNEAKVMINLSHPFIVAIDHPVQTKNSVYHIAEYVEGQDFINVFEKIGLFSSKDAQFYTGIILLILEYLSHHHIIIRDLKPELFRIDTKGFLKLINLSVCKQTTTYRKVMAKTFTIVGTPHYMAPDVILGKGYNNMADLWSLGVMVYQMLCGELPFGKQTENTYEIYQSIMYDELKFPQFITDKKAIRFISQLLNHNPDIRLNNSFQNLRSHQWLEDIYYEDLLAYKSNKIPVPYFPRAQYREYSGHYSQKLLDYIEQSQAKVKNPKGDFPNKKKQFHKETNWENFGPYI